MSIEKQRLLLKRKKFSKQIRKLFEELNNDKTLQEIFIENPMGVINNKVMDVEWTSKQVSIANKFLYSVLTNKQLLKWSKDYDNQENVEKDKAQMREDLAEAFLKYGDKEIMKSLIDLSSENMAFPGLDDEISSFALKTKSYYNERSNSSTKIESDSWFFAKVADRDIVVVRVGDDQDNLGEDVIFTAPEIRNVNERLIERMKEQRRQNEL